MTVESTYFCVFLHRVMRLNLRQAARMNEMLRVSWAIRQSLGTQLDSSSPLPVQKRGQR